MRLRDRFWIRGWTWLGLLNTAFAITCGRVLVRTIDTETRRTLEWEVVPASRWPRPI
jgi:hypothetical protein